jgi:uncharacterized protein YggE
MSRAYRMIARHDFTKSKYMIEIPSDYMKNLYRSVLAFLVIVSILFVVKVLSEFRNYQNTGRGYSTITLSGHGEVSAVPDIANVTFTIHKEAKTVKEAQEAVALVEKSALDSLEANKVDEKDIKTLNASFNPKYEYQQKLCPQTMGANGMMVPSYYCGSGKQVLTGYEAYENVSVKVRDVDTAGKIMQDLGTLGVSDLSGPDFSIDDEDELKAEARKDAIEDAQTKAEALARDLGVSLGDIMSFSEDGAYPVPVYYGKDMMMAESANVRSAPATLPKGENTITSDVSITYEIR